MKVHHDYRVHIEQYGDPSGRALLLYHGFPGSHVQGKMLDPLGKKLNLRVLAVDRPGYGYSEPQRGASLSDLTLSIEKGFDRLHIDKFFIVGVSGGNPGAVVAAGHFKSRVLALGSICGMAPFVGAEDTFSHFQRRGFRLFNYLPEFFIRASLDFLLRGFKPETRMQHMIERLDPVDQRVLNEPEVQQIMLESIQLAKRQLAAGITFDLRNYSRMWPVDFAEIRCPYLLWHGQKDRVLSPEMSRFMNKAVPKSKLFLYPEEGHYSLPICRTEEILTQLVASANA